MQSISKHYKVMEAIFDILPSNSNLHTNFYDKDSIDYLTADRIKDIILEYVIAFESNVRNLDFIFQVSADNVWDDILYLFDANNPDGFNLENIYELPQIIENNLGGGFSTEKIRKAVSHLKTYLKIQVIEELSDISDIMLMILENTHKILINILKVIIRYQKDEEVMIACMTS